MEHWDIYDKYRQLTGRRAIRGEKLHEGEYHLVVFALIKNSQNEILITKRTMNKTFPGMWEITGGAAISGDNSETAVLREIEEEIGITFTEGEGALINTFVHHGLFPYFGDIWLYQTDFDIKRVVCQPEEVSDARWVTVSDLIYMIDTGQFIKNDHVISGIFSVLKTVE